MNLSKVVFLVSSDTVHIMLDHINALNIDFGGYDYSVRFTSQCYVFYPDEVREILTILPGLNEIAGTWHIKRGALIDALESAGLRHVKGFDPHEYRGLSKELPNG